MILDMKYLLSKSEPWRSILSMIATQITFTNHVVDNVHSIISAQAQNKPSFWPLHWCIITEPKNGVDTGSLYAWLRKNCFHQFDITTDTLGRQIFGFESDEEATLFKLSF